MMQPTLVVTVGGEDFPLEKPSVQEVRQVKRWTGFASMPQWFAAVLREDGDALLASYVIAKRREGAHVDYNDTTDFPAKVTARFVDGEGREVEQVYELKPDGSVALDNDGDVIPVLDEEGEPQWRDVESGTVIPFDRPTKTTSSTPPPLTSAGDTGTGTSTIAAI